MPPLFNQRPLDYVYSNTLGTLDYENLRLQDMQRQLQANLNQAPRRITRQSNHDQLADETKGPTQQRKTGADDPSSRKRKSDVISGSSSSLSPTSGIASPIIEQKGPDIPLTRSSPSPSSSSLDSHQPPAALSTIQFQTFGPDPLTFDDPTVYHIREVTEDMTEEEKKEIYCVAQFPHNDLSHLIAGTPPDKDFSNAKPPNQVNANTFAAHVEPYFRNFTEEDLAFLKERVRSV